MKKRKRKPGYSMTPEQREQAQEAFLQAYGNIGIVRAACLHAGIHRSLVSYWRKHDKEFARQYEEEAKEDADDIIRAELFRRAIQGVDAPVVWQGQVMHYLDENGKPILDEPVTIKKYSDSLLALMARRLPEYQEKQDIDLNVKQEGGVYLLLPDNGRDPGDKG